MACYLDTKKNEDCCGCRACEHICKYNAIQMYENKEGFLYPKINETICVNCGICRKVCPFNADIKNSDINEIYAAQNKNIDMLEKSSSGGMFVLFAEHILNNKGVVYGCTFNDDFVVNQTMAINRIELSRMHGSKYVQSDTQKSYKKTKEMVDQGMQVLYSGTPCQIAGLKLYLRKNYDNLLTVDFLCHGVPSPKLFKNYLNSIEKKRKGKVIKFSFRDKSKKGWGIVTSYIINKDGKEKKYYENGNINSYSYGYTKGYFNRQCCYNCPFKGSNHYSDITIADYWGVRNYHPDLNAEKGVSILMINTIHGRKSFEEIYSKMIIEKTDIANASAENKDLIYSGRISEIPEIRNSIYELLIYKDYSSIEKKYLRIKNYYLLWLIDKIPGTMLMKIKGFFNK